MIRVRRALSLYIVVADLLQLTFNSCSCHACSWLGPALMYALVIGKEFARGQYSDLEGNYELDS